MRCIEIVSVFLAILFASAAFSFLIDGEFLEFLIGLVFSSIFSAIAYFLFKKKLKISNDNKTTLVKEAKETTIVNCSKNAKNEVTNTTYKYHTVNKTNAYVSIDIETTGLSYNDDIIQIAAVIYEDDKEKDHFSTYVKPSRSIPNEVTNINGITDDSVKDAPNINQALKSFFNFIDGYPIIGFNSDSFDISRIENKSNVRLKNDRNIDVKTLAMTCPNDFLSYTLPYLKVYYGIKAKSHDALVDARTTAKIYQHLKVKDYEPKYKENSNFDQFDGINFCISGKMNTGDKYIKNMIESRKGVLKNSMSKKINYFIVGPQTRTKNGGPSTKEKYYSQLIGEGLDIKKISEDDFLEMIMD